MRHFIILLAIVLSPIALVLPEKILNRIVKTEIGGEVLLRCARSNHHIVRSLLTTGLDPNLIIKCRDGVCGWEDAPIFAAAEAGNADVVDDLLRFGADVDIRSKSGRAAGINGQFEFAARPHIGFGGSCEIHCPSGDKDSNGVTPLMVAALRGHADVVTVLLAHGATIDARTDEGATALMFAACRGHKKVVQLLVSGGADVNARGTNNQTALMLATWNPGYFGHYNKKESFVQNQLNTVELLLNAGADLSAKTLADDTVLIGAAAAPNDSRLLQLLIDRGAALDDKNREGLTALMYSAQSLEPHNLNILVAGGADVNQRDAKNRTALMYVASLGNETNARILLDAGADIEASDSDGKTALMKAASSYYGLGMIRLMLDRGAAIGDRDGEGRSALWYAIDSDSPEMISLFIAAGASVNSKDNHGSTPLSVVAQWSHRPEVVKLLLKSSAGE